MLLPDPADYPPTNPWTLAARPPSATHFWAWFLSFAHPKHADEGAHFAAIDLFLAWANKASYAELDPPHESFEWLGGPHRRLFQVDLAFEARIDGEKHLFLLDADAHRGEARHHLFQQADLVQARHQEHQVIAIDFALGLLPGEATEDTNSRRIRLNLAACEQMLSNEKWRIWQEPLDDYRAFLRHQINESEHWKNEFKTTPNWHWLTTNLEHQPDLFHLEDEPEGADFWLQGMRHQAHERAVRRAAQLQWMLLQALQARLTRLEVPGHQQLRLHRVCFKRPHTWLEVLPFHRAAPGLAYRLGPARHGPELVLVTDECPSRREKDRRAWNSTREAMVDAWFAAAEAVGVPHLFQRGQTPTRIAHTHLPQHLPNPTAEGVEAWLDQVSLVHQAFVAPQQRPTPPMPRKGA